MTPEQTKKWWSDYVGDNYFTEFSFGFSRPDLIRRFKLGKGSPILEIGFGYGRELYGFCEISDWVYGVDLSDAAPALATCKLQEKKVKRLPSLTTYDGEKLPYQDDIFDLIYSCFVIQHMAKWSAVRLLEECRRVMAPNGRMLMEFFGCPDFYKPGLDEDAFSGIPGDKKSGPYGGMFNNAFTQKEIYRMAQVAGIWIEWVDIQPIHKETGFNNYWACFGKG